MKNATDHRPATDIIGMISIITCSIDQAKSDAIAAHYQGLMGTERKRRDKTGMG